MPDPVTHAEYPPIRTRRPKPVVDRYILYTVSLTGEEIDMIEEWCAAYQAEGWHNALSEAVSVKLDAVRKKVAPR